MSIMTDIVNPISMFEICRTLSTYRQMTIYNKSKNPTSQP